VAALEPLRRAFKAAFSLSKNNRTQRRIIMARHKVAGKKAHVKKVGKKRRGGKRHSKKSAIKA
jgi:hypothetical protein